MSHCLCRPPPTIGSLRVRGTRVVDLCSTVVSCAVVADGFLEVSPVPLRPVVREGGCVLALKKMRESAGLTVRELADRADVPYGQVGVWEAWGRGTKTARDPRRIRLDMAKRLADALGVTLDEFWAGLN